MAKQFDNQVLNTTIMGVVEDTFKTMLHVDFTAEPVAVEQDIIEYDSRMRVFPMEKFNGPCIIGVVNYYFSQKDLDEKRAVGAFVLFVKDEVVEKLFRAFNRPIAEVENEEIVLDVVGELTNIMAGNVKNELRDMGYADILISAPFKYKNIVPEGVQFDYDLYKKQEISFTFWKEKTIVVEACMGYVPQKVK